MEPLVKVYWTAKLGSTADEYEDAYAWSSNSRHFAIADGATESSFADRWARSLVQEYSRQPPALGALPDWIKPLQQDWHAGIHWDSLPWFAEEKARLGAFATLLGLSFSNGAARKPPRRPFFRRLRRPAGAAGNLSWRAFAIGDSCLFHIRDGALLTAFPLTRSDQFQSRPLLVSSNPAHNDTVWGAVQVAEGDCRPGDLFLALTDALAKWFLAEIEQRREPWSQLGALENTASFDRLVHELRAEKKLRNDDTTMLWLRWGNPGEPRPTPASPAKDHL